MPFKVGDVIRQTHQQGAPNRLVVKLTDDPDVVIVYDPDELRLRRVLAWGHTIVVPATPESEEEALVKLIEHAGRPVGGVTER